MQQNSNRQNILILDIKNEYIFNMPFTFLHSAIILHFQYLSI